MAGSTEGRIMIGIATAGIVLAVHNKGMPTNADVRVGPPGDDAIETIRKQNLWLSAGIVSGIYLLTKDSVAFMMGGAMTVGLDWINRANIFSNPATNGIIPNPFDVGVKQDESSFAQREDAGRADLYAVN